ncbi:MAG: FAD-dependent oxidoreductase [Oscillospiraceae bacterium]|nr:FAD-dependent oxidoreductase [Oscillospiraceae bacterium]
MIYNNCFDTDVLVVGGGLGGLAAALGSARAGAKTMLLERNTYLGGVATAGMCCSVFNCLFTRGRKLAVSGIPLEITDLLADSGGPGMSWRRHKGHVIYDLELAKLSLDKLAQNNAVQLLLETMVTDVAKENGRLTGVRFIGKGGAGTISAKAVVDATGDSDVAHMAGAPLITIPREGFSRSSYCFRMGNVDLDGFVDYFRNNPGQYPELMDIEWSLAEALAQYEDNGTFLFPHGGGMQMDIMKKGIESGELKLSLGVYDTMDATQMHGIRNTKIMHIVTGYTKISLDAFDISRAITDGREMAHHAAQFMRKRMPGFENAFVCGFADNLGIRASRYIHGDFVFTAQMKSTPSRFEDAIGQGVVEVQQKLHKAKNAWGAQIFGDDVYQIPYRCLLPRNVDGLIMGAGRSVSADNPYLLRVMATTMTIGQAAGIAAATSAKEGEELRRLDVCTIQRELAAQGVDLTRDF